MNDKSNKMNRHEHALSTVADVVRYLDSKIPLSLQESYDNCGLQVGVPEQKVTGILLAVDTTEEIIEEALRLGFNMIVTHHPLLFKGVKKIGVSSYIERSLRLLLKHDIALYAAHTNLDNLQGGLNYKFAELLDLQSPRVIDPLPEFTYKIVVYTPKSHAEAIRVCLLEAGAGTAGRYEGCSFTFVGEGRFRPRIGANPYVGTIDQWHTEEEVAIATMCSKAQLPDLLNSLREVHPYEEPVIDIVPLRQEDTSYGAGIIGDLPQELSFTQFIKLMQKTLPLDVIAHSRPCTDRIRRVAYCGGSGAFLRHKAAALGADVFVTGEAKYNDYYDARDDITLCTMGHYETEVIAKEVLKDLFSQKKTNFTVQLSTRCNNPITYISR